MFSQQVNENLLLRMLKVSEDTKLFTLIDHNRLFLQKWLAWVHEIDSIADCRQFITKSFEAYANQDSLTAGIFYKNELAGIIGFNSIDVTNKVGTIGYWLGEDFQGKGIMTTAVQEIITHGFRDLHLNRLQLFVAVENSGSRAIPERLHFHEEGIAREHEWLNGKPVDQVLYSLLQSEWTE
ncbi:MAG TPA: GNAT family protein [Bacillota bacterium]|nr:GNAT family protein [Bacillota bacterium]